MANHSHEPDAVSSAEVMALVSFGHTQTQIATYLDIDEKTLQKHYRRELDTAEVIANANVAKRLYNKATSQDDLSAQIFWLKTRARWRTADKEIDDLDKANIALLEELTELRAKLAKAAEKEY